MIKTWTQPGGVLGLRSRVWGCRVFRVLGFKGVGFLGFGLMFNFPAFRCLRVRACWGLDCRTSSFVLPRVVHLNPRPKP